MNKINILLILFSTLISSCSYNDESLKILSPTSGPSFAFYNEANNINFETNSTPANIIASLNNNSNYDLVVIDTLNGIKQINNGVNFKLAATLTFGNFYLCGTGNDLNNTLDKEDYIVIFNKNGTPDILFKYLYGDDYNTHYVSSLKEASMIYKTKMDITNDNQTVDYVLLSEPSILNLNANIYEDLTLSYTNKTGNMIFQASIFVNNNSDNKLVNKYLTNLEKNINNALENPSIIYNYVGNLSNEEYSSKYGLEISKIEKILMSNKINLGYKKAIDYKKQIDSYLKLYGVGETNEEIYFK